jgi:hypothetical protein
MGKTAELLRFTRYPCIAHSLHNSVNRAMKQCKELQDLTTKCHSLVLLFHNSPKMAQALREEQDFVDKDSTPVAVVLDVVTRWNSTLRMLQRLLRLRGPLESLIFMADEQLSVDKETISKLKGLRLTTTDWSQVEQLIDILKPFDDMTLVFSSADSGLVACVAPWVVGLMASLETEDGWESELLTSFRQALAQEVKKRIVLTDDYLVASALHPSFNTLWFLDDENERSERYQTIKDRIRREYLDAAPPPECGPSSRGPFFRRWGGPSWKLDRGKTAEATTGNG